MKLRIHHDLRHSVATELKKASWGVAVLSAWFGLDQSSPLAIGVTAVTWFLLQLFAHLILALDDED